jgi:hypothetical protein
MGPGGRQASAFVFFFFSVLELEFKLSTTGASLKL